MIAGRLSGYTAGKASKIRLYDWQYFKNGRLESNLWQFSFTESAEATHHSSAKPAIVSTSQVRPLMSSGLTMQ